MNIYTPFLRGSLSDIPSGRTPKTSGLPADGKVSDKNRYPEATPGLGGNYEWGTNLTFSLLCVCVIVRMSTQVCLNTLLFCGFRQVSINPGHFFSYMVRLQAVICFHLWGQGEGGLLGRLAGDGILNDLSRKARPPACGERCLQTGVSRKFSDLCHVIAASVA